MMIPIPLGSGKRLFENGTIPPSFRMTSSKVPPKGIIIVTYKRDGNVKTGEPEIKGDVQ